MQPRAVRPEEDPSRARATHSIHEVIETSDAGRIGVDVRVSNHHIDEREMRPPVVREASEVRDDEGHVRVLGGH